jgi:hypothetical protein
MVRLLPGDLSISDDVIAEPAGDWPESPDGYGSWEATGTGMIWNWTTPDQSGVYQAVLDDSILYQVAVTTPAAESDLKSLESGTLDTQGTSNQRIGFRNVRDSGDDKDRLWNWLLVACLLGLVLEVCVLRVFQT